jgi:hypothetical protein
VGGGVANVTGAYVDLAKAEVEFKIVSTQRQAVAKVEEVRAAPRLCAHPGTASRAGPRAVRRHASRLGAPRTCAPPVIIILYSYCPRPCLGQTVDGIKAIPVNIKSDLSTRAQQAADRIAGLPSELKGLASSAAGDAAASLKARTKSRTDELYGGEE